MSVIELANVEFSYPGRTVPTLRIPDFRVEAGERIFLYGPSGSGKTTLLEVLAGVLVPRTGQVSLLGQDLAKMTGSARDRFRADHVGYVFQSFNLIPYLNVRENIDLPLSFSERRRAKVSDVARTRAHFTESLGIGGQLEDDVVALSVGQQQRVAVARALMGAPEIILADEPTSALDADHRERFLRLLFGLADETGSTIVFVSHDRSVESLFSRTVSLAALQGGAR